MAPRTFLALLAFLAFISLGLPDGLLGVAWPSIRSGFGLPIDALGLLLTFSTAGYLTSSFFAGRILRVLPIGTVLALSTAAAAPPRHREPHHPRWARPFSRRGGAGCASPKLAPPNKVLPSSRPAPATP